MKTITAAVLIAAQLATAAPAGPAFEAAQIRCGMRAAGVPARSE